MEIPAPCNRCHGHPELVKLIGEERARRQEIKSKIVKDEALLLEEEIII